MWIERLSTTTASDNELSDKPDNLRVESRPRFMDQVQLEKIVYIVFTRK